VHYIHYLVFGIKGFEDDLHKHIHLENNFLHPKAIKMEKGIINKEIVV